MDNLPFQLSDFLTRPQALAYIRSKGYRVGERYLSNIAQHKSLGPRYFKIGMSCLYLPSDIDAWISSPTFQKSIPKIHAAA
jgi:hypothetical protein